MTIIIQKSVGAFGHYDSAIADYNKYIELQPEDVSAYSNRANCYSGKGDFANAMADYNKAIALNPKFGAAYKNRGILFLKINDRQRAILDFEKALTLQLDPSDEEQVMATLQNLR